MFCYVIFKRGVRRFDAAPDAVAWAQGQHSVNGWSFAVWDGESHCLWRCKAEIPKEV